MSEGQPQQTENERREPNLLDKSEIVRAMVPMIVDFLNRRTELRRKLTSSETSAELAAVERHLRIVQEALHVRIGSVEEGDETWKKVTFSAAHKDRARYTDISGMYSRPAGSVVEIISPVIVDDDSVKIPRVYEKGIYK